MTDSYEKEITANANLGKLRISSARMREAPQGYTGLRRIEIANRLEEI